MSTNRPSLAHLLAEATHKANQERVDKQQVERITAAVKAQLAHKHKAEAGDDDLVCPSCGYKGPEADFEPDTDDDADGFRTDPVTGESGQNDPDNEGDRPAEYDHRLKALKAKYAGRNLTVVDRILINRGFDPFAD
jgi:hypothetical protein